MANYREETTNGQITKWLRANKIIIENPEGGVTQPSGEKQKWNNCQSKREIHFDR